jgi:hypothetical protein
MATEFREARDSLPEEPRGVVPARFFSLKLSHANQSE